jgi:hypothetical protein
LRSERYSSEPSIASAADAAFGTWHAASVAINLLTLVSTGAALALASQLPAPFGNGGTSAQPAGAGARSDLAGGATLRSGMVSDHASTATEGLRDLGRQA